MAASPGIASSPSWDGERFDPLSCVRQVNRLQAAGAEAALAELAEFAKGHTDPMESTRAFFLLRLLFTNKDQSAAPPIRVGAPTDATAPPAGAFPLYPLALESDVPLLLVPGFELAGFPESPQAHIEHFKRNGTLRSAPLRPIDDPLDLADRLLASPSWYRPAAELEDDRALLRAQLLRLVRDALPANTLPTPDDALAGTLRSPARWQSIRDAFRAQGAHWTGDRYATGGA